MSYIMDNIDTYADQLNKEYSLDERRFLVKLCAQNSVDEFIAAEKPMSFQTGFSCIEEKFNANFKLRHFEHVPFSPKMSAKTIQILNVYNVIDEELTLSEKNSLDAKSRDIIASD